MNLRQLIQVIEMVAIQQPSVNMIVKNDVFRINSAPKTKYGVFAWTQGQHSGSVNGMTTFSFTFFYIDRLNADQSNQIEIQSVGCETLCNILRLLDDMDIDIKSYTMQPFNQRFTDECAGIFCNVSLSVPTTMCGESHNLAYGGSLRVTNLRQLIRATEMVAIQQPSVNMIVQNDVFRINSAPSLKYGIFAWTQGQHSGSINGMQTFNLSLFYVDRLTEDQSNQIEIQSVGCETISNILRLLDEMDVAVETYTMQPFNQRFTDECAGVFCNVSLSVPAMTLCGDPFADFNNDFNEDFLIF